MTDDDSYSDTNNPVTTEIDDESSSMQDNDL